MLRRLWLNLCTGWFRLPRWFPKARMRAIRDAIAEGERRHAGELCFAVEARYSPLALWAGLTPRGRAEQLFSALRVWDTADNSGVLLYLQLAERRVEIVADRGIAARVPAAEWQALTAAFAEDMRCGEPSQAVLACLGRINALLALHFPASADNPRELPDEPVVL
ncbi:membrane protein [Arenimonas maotaiensis]|uniref:Membrane protein n=1 Tax=Arenimonas maotaiensis TaxID=1446479 RepID=A0A917CJS6_9GAMM|nr:TPM domain-containing protein [Arenimonas maotaiensis]GGF90651.1 membrane protein [Arenimonas maotaiensis]